MKNILRLEEAAMFGLALYLNTFLHYEDWVFWVLFLLPDLSMLAYLINPRIGAISYNLFHHKGIAIALYLAGLYAIRPELTLAGLVLFAHSSFDRIFGYGLKFFDNFKNTHLGWIGKS